LTEYKSVCIYGSMTPGYATYANLCTGYGHLRV
jgi:hypothetical protein